MPSDGPCRLGAPALEIGADGIGPLDQALGAILSQFGQSRINQVLDRGDVH